MLSEGRRGVDEVYSLSEGMSCARVGIAANLKILLFQYSCKSETVKEYYAARPISLSLRVYWFVTCVESAHAAC